MQAGGKCFQMTQARELHCLSPEKATVYLYISLLTFIPPFVAQKAAPR